MQPVAEVDRERPPSIRLPIDPAARRPRCTGRIWRTGISRLFVPILLVAVCTSGCKVPFTAQLQELAVNGKDLDSIRVTCDKQSANTFDISSAGDHGHKFLVTVRSGKLFGFNARLDGYDLAFLSGMEGTSLAITSAQSDKSSPLDKGFTAEGTVFSDYGGPSESQVQVKIVAHCD